MQARGGKELVHRQFGKRKVLMALPHRKTSEILRVHLTENLQSGSRAAVSRGRLKKGTQLSGNSIGSRACVTGGFLVPPTHAEEDTISFFVTAGFRE